MFGADELRSRAWPDFGRVAIGFGALGLGALFAAAVAALDPVVSLQLRVALLIVLGGVSTTVIVGARRIGIALVFATLLSIGFSGVTLVSTAKVSDGFLLLALVALSPSIFTHHQLLRPALPWLLAVGVIVVGGLLATTFSVNPTESVLNIMRLTFAAMGLQVLIVLWEPDDRWVKRAMWAFVISASFVALTGLGGARDFAGRSYGMTPGPNHLALTTVIATGFALALWTLAGVRVRIALSIAMLVLAGAVLESGSRAGLLGLAAVTVLFVGGYNVRGGIWLSAGGGVAAVLVAILLAAGAVEVDESTAVGRFLSGNDLAAASTNEHRLQLELTLDDVNSSPVVGQGFDDSIYVAHNVYLQLWRGAGLIGLAGFLLVAALAATFYLRVQRVLQTSSRSARSILAFGLASAFLAYLVFALFQNMLWDRYIWLGPALMTALRPYLGEGTGDDAGAATAGAPTSHRARGGPQ